MIKSLDITGFQSWEVGHFDFHPGVNVIVGSSRNGKTAVLRALRWSCENQPGGDAFRRWGAKETRCDLTTGEGAVITRLKRGTSHNEYVLDGQEFKAFGQGVPEPIELALNLEPELNCQWQHDRPFLLSETAGEVARRLNKVARLDVIDRALSGIDSLLRASRAEVMRKQDAVASGTEALATYDYLPALEKAIKQLEEVEGKQKAVRECRGALSVLVEAITHAQIAFRHFKSTDGAAELCEELEGAAAVMRDTRSRISGLRQLGTLVRSVRLDLEVAAELAAAEPEVDGILAKAEELKTIGARALELYNMVAGIDQQAKHGELIQGTLAALEAEWECTAPDTCPLCNGSGSLKCHE